MRNGEGTRLEVNGMVVGAFPFAKYDESELPSNAETWWIFFTTVFRAGERIGEMFGEDRLV